MSVIEAKLPDGCPTRITATPGPNGEKSLDVNLVNGITITADPVDAAAQAAQVQAGQDTVTELQTLVADMITLLSNQVAQTTELQTIVINQAAQTTELQNQVVAQNATTAALTALATASAGDATAINQAAQITELQTLVTTQSNALIELQDILDELDHKATALVHEEHDDIEATVFNSNGDPTTIVYRLGGVLVATVEVTYDASFNWVRSRRV